MITNKLRLMIGALAVGVTVVGTTALAFGGKQLAPIGNVYAGNDIPYNCASIHFGTVDAPDYSYVTGLAYLGSSRLSAGTSLGTVSGVTMTSYTPIKVGSEKKHGVFYNNSSLKLSSGSYTGQITFTFEENIIGCTVYAIGWKDKMCNLSVNGESIDIISDEKITGTTSVDNINFYPYTFTFTETNTITIGATKNKSIVIGDIALRVKK